MYEVFVFLTKLQISPMTKQSTTHSFAFLCLAMGNCSLKSIFLSVEHFHHLFFTFSNQIVPMHMFIYEFVQEVGMSRSYKMHFNCTWEDICSHFSCTWTKCVCLMEAEVFVWAPYFGRLIFSHFKCKRGLSMAIGLEDPSNLNGWKWLESEHMLFKNLSVYSLTYIHPG